ncbi:MAG: peptidase M28 family protein, partial [Pseudomonadota bacterium]
MNPFHFAAIISATSLAVTPTPSRADDLQNLKANIMNDGTSYTDLRALTRDIGPRMSGSIGAEKAVDWSLAKLNSYHLDRVWKQPVQVPHWERGTVERAIIIGGSAPIPLAVTALGRSAGTAGIDARVVEVQSLDEVRALGFRVRGKIVFYNRPMDPTLENPFAA